MGATGLRTELSSSITTVNTKFEKTYKSQGYTFTNITAYASDEAIKEKSNLSTDENDRSMVFEFKVNGQTFMQPGDMTNQILPNDDKFMKKVLSNKVDFLLAAHHGSGNSMTDVYETMAEKGWAPKQVVISRTSDPSSENPDFDWSEFSGGILSLGQMLLCN